MTCEDVQKSILTGDGSRSAEVRAHLDCCRECRDYRQILMMLAGASDEPTTELDSRTKHAIFAVMRRQQSMRQLRVYLASVAAIVACLVVCALPLALFVTHRVAEESQAQQVASVVGVGDGRVSAVDELAEADAFLAQVDVSMSGPGEFLLENTSFFEQALGWLDTGMLDDEDEQLTSGVPAGSSEDGDLSQRLADSVCLENELDALLLMMCSL